MILLDLKILHTLQPRAIHNGGVAPAGWTLDSRGLCYSTVRSCTLHNLVPSMTLVLHLLVGLLIPAALSSLPPQNANLLSPVEMARQP